MGMARIQVVVDDGEREAGRRSMHRDAAAELTTRARLAQFFADLDEVQGEDAEEDWDDTKRRIASGRTPSVPT